MVSAQKDGFDGVTLFEDKQFDLKASRSILVRNLNRTLKQESLHEEFERFGPLQHLNSRHWKEEGFVVADYWDLRDCCRAFKAFSLVLPLGNSFLCQPGTRLDVHFFVPHINEMDGPFVNEGKLLIQGLPNHDSALAEFQNILQHFGDVRRIIFAGRGVEGSAWIVEYFDTRHAGEARAYLNTFTIESRSISATFLNGYSSWANAGFASTFSQQSAKQASSSGFNYGSDFSGSTSRRPSYSSYHFPSPLSSCPQSRSPSPIRSSSPPPVMGPSSNSTPVSSAATSSTSSNLPQGSQSVGSSRYLPSPPSSPPSTVLSPPNHFHYSHVFQQNQAAAHPHGAAHHPVDSKHHPTRIPENFHIDLDNIRNGYDKRTTLMIRNIPNKYTQDMFLEFVNETHKGKYDFIYLPIDFKNKCNVGYAFLNFIDPVSIIALFNRIQGKKWTRFNSEKICAVSYARIQGKENLIRHFQNSTIMSECIDYRPKIFFSTGPHMGLEETFPEPNVPYTPSFDHTLCCQDSQPKLGCNHAEKMQPPPQNFPLPHPDRGERIYYPNYLS